MVMGYIRNMIIALIYVTAVYVTGKTVSDCTELSLMSLPEKLYSIEGDEVLPIIMNVINIKCTCLYML